MTMRLNPKTFSSVFALVALAPAASLAQDAAPEDAADATLPEGEGQPEAPAAEEQPAETPPAETPAAETPPPAGEPEEAPPEEAVAPPAPAPAEPAPAPEPEAPTLLPLKVGTDTWSRFEYRDKYTELGVARPRFVDGDSVFFRARMSVETNPLKLTDSINAVAYLAPQASGVMGTQGVGGTVGEAALGIYEGYFKIQGKKLTGKVGRFAMNYGDALVIGNLDWHQAGRAFDGAHFSYKAGKANIDAFATLTSEGYPAQSEPFFVGDSYFFGLYAQLGKLLSESLELDLYALGKATAATDIVTDATTTPPTTLHKDGGTFATLGARVKQKVGLIDYRVEAGLQAGKVPGPATPALDRFAYQASGELGLSPVPQFRVSVGGELASGDDPTTADKNEGYEELYPTTHKWLGLTDVIGVRTNIVSANVKLTGKITDTTMLSLDGHLFSRLEEAGLGRSPDATSDLAGYEINAQVMQKIGQYAYARGLYGVFLTNEDHYGTSETPQFVEIQAGLKF